MEEKRGLKKLGFVTTLNRNKDNRENCMSILSKMVGREITQTELDAFIESPAFQREYLDVDGNLIDLEQNALAFRFRLPYQDKQSQDIYGYFERKNISTYFVGVFWKTQTQLIDVKRFGQIHESTFKSLMDFCNNVTISLKNINDYIRSVTYHNGAGYVQFQNRTPVTKENGKFIKLQTSLETKDDKPIIGWFTKNTKDKYEGIDWGTEEDFKLALRKREQFFVGRMAFDSLGDCNAFLVRLKEQTIPEPWKYKKKSDSDFQYPILKSYLEFELERLYYEHEVLKHTDKIIYNRDKSKVLFNTNLIDKFGHDLIVVGDLFCSGCKEYIQNIEISSSKKKMKDLGFDSSCEPIPPKFFQDINEIIFHSEWEIDQDMEKYEHIVEERIDRFPFEFQKLSTDDLGVKLDHAIDFAKRIAQRNYKFIVPMYYPKAKRIQLLMPIYLETSYTAHPDFALVLTPHPDNERGTGLYTPETILGLDEVYQDARLIAKPEESWLNPEMIE